ncbi:MAG: hypothetical protein ACRDRR_05675 [Pseudonocardiaceae bacterium]
MGRLATAPQGASFGVDFKPVPNALRVVSGTPTRRYGLYLITLLSGQAELVGPPGTSCAAEMVVC